MSAVTGSSYMLPFVPGPSYTMRSLFAFWKVVIDKADLQWLNVEKLAADFPSRVQILGDTVTFVGPVNIRAPYNPSLGPFQYLPKGFDKLFYVMTVSLFLLTSAITLIFAVVVNSVIKERLLIEQQERVTGRHFPGNQEPPVGWLGRTFVKADPITFSVMTGLTVTAIPLLAGRLLASRPPQIDFYQWPFNVRIT